MDESTERISLTPSQRPAPPGRSSSTPLRGHPRRSRLRTLLSKEQTFEMMDPTFLPDKATPSEPGVASSGRLIPRRLSPGRNEPGSTEPGSIEPVTTEGDDEGRMQRQESNGSWALFALLMMSTLFIRKRRHAGAGLPPPVRRGLFMSAHAPDVASTQAKRPALPSAFMPRDRLRRVYL